MGLDQIGLNVHLPIRVCPVPSVPPSQAMTLKTRAFGLGKAEPQLLLQLTERHPGATPKELLLPVKFRTPPAPLDPGGRGGEDGGWEGQGQVGLPGSEVSFRALVGNGFGSLGVLVAGNGHLSACVRSCRPGAWRWGGWVGGPGLKGVFTGHLSGSLVGPGLTG